MGTGMGPKTVPTVTVDGNTTEVALAVLAAVDQVPPAGAGGQLDHWGSSAGQISGIGSTKPSMSPVTFTWTPVTGPWVSGGAAVRPAELTDVDLLRFDAVTYGAGTLVSWRTAIERDVTGFVVETEVGGQRARLTPVAIESKGIEFGSPGPHDCEWWDAHAESGRRDWFGAIETNGEIDWHGPSRFKALVGWRATASLGNTERFQGQRLISAVWRSQTCVR